MGKTNKLPMILFMHVDPLVCAQYHADEHIEQKLIATVTAMYAVAYKAGYTVPAGVGASAFVKDEVVIWGESSILHWDWLFNLAMCLNHEYRYRNEIMEDHTTFHDVHDLILHVQANPGLIERGELAPPPVHAAIIEPRGFELSSSHNVQDRYCRYYRDQEDTDKPYNYTKRDRPEFLRTPEGVTSE